MIIVQNLSVPFDRRVWLECQALTAAGYDVTVVCPRGPGDPAHRVLDGVEVFTYAAYAPGGSAVSFVLEYLHSFLHTAYLVATARRRRGRFAVLQACNPPDIFWPLGLALRGLDGTAFVFDHHDLCPELYESRFPEGNPLPRKGLLALEWATMRTAQRVISTNCSYREVAMTRGGKRAQDVTVVRTGPDADTLKRLDPVPALRRGRRHLVAYLGVMGPQDGVDLAVKAAAHVVHTVGRTDVSFTFMGSGDSYGDLIALREELGLTDYVDLPGRVSDQLVADVLSTAAVGLSPDPKNPLNDLSTMNKTMEYMAFELPVVAFDLCETRVSAGDAARYVPDGDIAGYAQAILDLLDDEPTRAQLGRYARARVETELAWPHSRTAYLEVYRSLTGGPEAGGDPSGGATGTDGATGIGGRVERGRVAGARLVDLRDRLTRRAGV